MSNVLGIVGSPRKNGNTHILVSRILEGAEQQGATVESVFLGELSIKECDGCYACWHGCECSKQVQDDVGIISSILCGPDARTRIIENTTKCMFAVYAPTKIKQSLIEEHFNEIIENIRLFAPRVVIESRQIYQAN